jgi:hypothetical protein
MELSYEQLISIREATDSYFDKHTHYDMSLNRSDFILMLYSLIDVETDWARAMFVSMASTLGVEIV